MIKNKVRLLKWNFDTKLIHGGISEDKATGAVLGAGFIWHQLFISKNW